MDYYILYYIWITHIIKEFEIVNAGCEMSNDC